MMSVVACPVGLFGGGSVAVVRGGHSPTRTQHREGLSLSPRI